MNDSSARDSPYAFGAVLGRDATTAAELALLERTRAYLAAIEASSDAEATDPDGALAFYDPGVRQEELPNRLVPTGAVRDLAALRDAAARGRGVLRAMFLEFSGDRIVAQRNYDCFEPF